MILPYDLHIYLYFVSIKQNKCSDGLSRSWFHRQRRAEESRNQRTKKQIVSKLFPVGRQTVSITTGK